MKTNMMRGVLVTATVSLMGCAPTEADAPASSTDVSEQILANNCATIPECKELLTASEGPFKASLMTTEDAAGVQRRRLTVVYTEPTDRPFLVWCDRSPNPPALSLVFITGPENARTSITRPAPESCPTSYGDGARFPNSATFSLVEDEDPVSWETLFPRQPNGSRWYALQVAASNARGQWDSRFGNNYPLVLEPR